MALDSLLTQLPAPFSGIPVWILIILMLWTFTWKGLALWKSARLSQPVWFVILLVVNTFGILEILYIFVFSRLGFDHLRGKSRKKRK